jgi:hypothetical protein
MIRHWHFGKWVVVLVTVVVVCRPRRGMRRVFVLLIIPQKVIGIHLGEWVVVLLRPSQERSEDDDIIVT